METGSTEDALFTRMARVPAGAAWPIWCSEVFGRALCCRELGVQGMEIKKRPDFDDTRSVAENFGFAGNGKGVILKTNKFC